MDVTTLPDDPAALKAIIATLARQRDEAARQRDEAARQRDEAQLKALRLEHQLERLKKRYYGPRADRLEVGQLLLEFAVALEGRPLNGDDLPPPMSVELRASELAMLLDGIDLRSVKRVKRYARG